MRSRGSVGLEGGYIHGWSGITAQVCHCEMLSSFPGDSNDLEKYNNKNRGDPDP